MKVAFALKSQLLNKVIVKEMSDLPRIGDHVNLFCTPAPKVRTVVWFPPPIVGIETCDVILELG